MNWFPVRALCLVFAFSLCISNLSGTGSKADYRTCPFGVSAAMASEVVPEEEEPFEEKVESVSDPLEPLNRAFFKVNDKLYFWVFKPIATVYSWYVPKGVRVCVRNAFDNVVAPVRIVNTAFQGKFKGTGAEFGRLVINSTLGVGGMFDIASRDFNLDPYDEDLGQTFGHYGAKPGLYIVWPLLGPSTLRDSIGFVGDSFLDPISWVVPDAYARAGIKLGKETNKVSLRIGEYEDFKQSALDPYVSLRHAYMQHRAEEIRR